MIEANIHPEPIPARVMRQVASGTLDEARLLPAPDKRERDVRKSLARLAEHKSWYQFAAGQAYVMLHGKAAGQRNAGITLVREATRWRAEVKRYAPDGLAGFDALIQHALSNPVPLPQRQDRP